MDRRSPLDRTHLNTVRVDDPDDDLENRAEQPGDYAHKIPEEPILGRSRSYLRSGRRIVRARECYEQCRD